MCPLARSLSLWKRTTLNRLLFVTQRFVVIHVGTSSLALSLPVSRARLRLRYALLTGRRMQGFSRLPSDHLPCALHTFCRGGVTSRSFRDTGPQVQKSMLPASRGSRSRFLSADLLMCTDTVWTWKALCDREWRNRARTMKRESRRGRNE